MENKALSQMQPLELKKRCEWGMTQMCPRAGTTEMKIGAIDLWVCDEHADVEREEKLEKITA